MATLVWKEKQDGSFEAVPKEGVLVRVAKTGTISEWRIIVGGKWKKRGVCRDLSAAKDMASKESAEFLRG